MSASQALRGVLAAVGLASSVGLSGCGVSGGDALVRPDAALRSAGLHTAALEVHYKMDYIWQYGPRVDGKPILGDLFVFDPSREETKIHLLDQPQNVVWYVPGCSVDDARIVPFPTIGRRPPPVATPLSARPAAAIGRVPVVAHVRWGPGGAPPPDLPLSLSAGAEAGWTEVRPASGWTGYACLWAHLPPERVRTSEWRTPGWHVYRPVVGLPGDVDVVEIVALRLAGADGTGESLVIRQRVGMDVRGFFEAGLHTMAGFVTGDPESRRVVDLR